MQECGLLLTLNLMDCPCVTARQAISETGHTFHDILYDKTTEHAAIGNASKLEDSAPSHAPPPPPPVL